MITLDTLAELTTFKIDHGMSETQIHNWLADLWNHGEVDADWDTFELFVTRTYMRINSRDGIAA